MNLIKKGATDVTRYVNLVDSAAGTPETGYTITNLDLQYTRNRTAPATKVDATALAATDSAHADNKAIEVDSTSSPGLYRIDWPDAAFASGADKVILVVSGAGLHPAVEEIQLVNFDPEDGTRLGLTALPNAAADAAGGLPISDAGGLDLDAQIGTKINDILTDTGTTLQGELDGIQADTEDIQSRLPAALGANGNIKADVRDYGGTAGTFSGGRPEVNTTHWGGTAVASANVLIDNAITAAKIASDAITAAKIQDGAITAAKFAANALDAVWSTATRTLTAATNITAGISSAVWSESVRVLTAATNLNIPSAATIAAAVWDYLTSAASTAGSLGKLIVDNLNATVSSRSSHSASDVWAVGTRTLTAATNITAGIAAAVWEVATSGLTTAGTIGKLLVDNINATISSRASQTSVDDVPTNAELATALAAADDAVLAAIAALNNLSSAQAQAAAQAAIEANHLDHLLAVDYDPANKPGVATALLNELIESDAGVSQFTANALEEAPAGGGGGGGNTYIFAPVLTELTDRLKPFVDAPLYVGDTSQQQMAVYRKTDAGTYVPQDLTEFGAMTLYLEDGRNVAVQTILDGDLSIDGSDNNLLLWTPDTATVASVRKLKAALRQDSDGMLIASGTFDVQYQPGP